MVTEALPRRSQVPPLIIQCTYRYSYNLWTDIICRWSHSCIWSRASGYWKEWWTVVYIGKDIKLIIILSSLCYDGYEMDKVVIIWHNEWALKEVWSKHWCSTLAVSEWCPGLGGSCWRGAGLEQCWWEAGLSWLTLSPPGSKCSRYLVTKTVNYTTLFSKWYTFIQNVPCEPNLVTCSH